MFCGGRLAVSMRGHPSVVDVGFPDAVVVVVVSSEAVVVSVEAVVVSVEAIVGSEELESTVS